MIKSRQKINSNKCAVQKGFTLIELMISLFMFSVAMAAMDQTFVGLAGAYRSSRDIQRHVEDAQQAINMMVKQFRTSSVSGAGDAQSVRVFDYSEPTCYDYKFSGSKLTYQSASVADKAACFSWGPAAGGYKDLANTNLTGNFFIDASSTGHVGKVVISVLVNNQYLVESSVSLRDYDVSGVVP